MPTTRSRLSAIYRAARYRVRVDGRWVALRLGAKQPTVARLLARRHADGAAFLGAANPGSRWLGASTNARRHAGLCRLLARWRLRPLRGEASDVRGGWCEPFVLVPGMGPARARRLARRFGQVAWLQLGRDGSARLLFDDARGDDAGRGDRG